MSIQISKATKWSCHAGFVIIIFTFLFFAICSCSTVSAIFHYTKSTGHFIPLSDEQRVLYEPGAAQFAKVTAELLPAAIQTVEKEQYSTFVKDIRVYVFETTESFNNLTGTNAKAVTYRDSVFMSSKLMENQKDIPLYLTHELSHLMILQKRGLYGLMTLPAWFNEGLATYVSKGGGAGNITEKEAINAILSGKAFEPDTGGGFFDFFFPKYGSHWNLEPHMFYRQSSLFVAFLHRYDKECFKNLIVAIELGQGFDSSFYAAYHISLPEMWQLFIQELKSDTKKEKLSTDLS